jgi:hypothetical protein
MIHGEVLKDEFHLVDVEWNTTKLSVFPFLHFRLRLISGTNEL